VIPAGYALLSACTDGPAAPIRLAEHDDHAVAVRTEGPRTVTCSAGEDVRSADVDGEGFVRGLLADTTYDCDSGDYATSVKTPSIPSDLQLGTVEVAADVPWHLLNVNHEQADRDLADRFLVIVDERGRPRWQLEGVGGSDIDATWLGDGQILFGGDNYYGEHLPPTVIDLDGAVLWQADDERATRLQDHEGWHHDVGFDAENPDRLWALTGETVGSGAAEYRSFIVLGIDHATGETVTTWSGSGHADALPEGEEWDRWHANAIWDVAEGDETALYLSLRRVGAVVKIWPEADELAWWLGYGGDWTLLEADGTEADVTRWFYGQHDVKRIGDRLTMFDNSARRPTELGTPPTRVLELALDEEARTARIAFEWSLTPAWSAYRWGGVDPLDDGGYCVNATRDPVEDAGNEPTQLLHVSAGGAVEWQVTFEEGTGMYRAMELESFP
jgi:hypothetical protein